VRNGVRLILLALLLMATAPAAGRDKGIRLETEDIGVSAVESELITKSKARKVLMAGRNAFAKIANHLRLTSESIFHQRADRPVWAKWRKGESARIWIRFEDEVDAKDLGADAYLRRMEAGSLRIHMQAFEEDLTPLDTYFLWRELTHAVLAQTTWTACPLWLREGLAEHMGVVGAKDDPAILAELKKEITDYEEISIAKLLAAPNRGVWERNGGRAVSWALVRMMEASNKDFVPMLHLQAARLLCRIAPDTNVRLLPREMREIVHGSLEASGGKPDRLAQAFAAWVEEGFPEKSPYLRSGAHRILKKLKPPKGYGLQIKARFGVAHTTESASGRRYQWRKFRGAEMVWRFPWPSRMDSLVGVRARQTRIPRPRPRRRNDQDDDDRDSDFEESQTWDAGPQGKVKLSSGDIPLPDPRLAKIGFVCVIVTSPVGVCYRFVKEYPLR
jgi:hypothetical protein